ncbi:L,D-transpeptidase family protein [Lachnospiraceae bacterium Oil+RF-744-WCA-WT-11]|uniref:L,D-transpeptidase family protein n=2 Tax=Porcincola intestinalis TaxID=2606632 RepID=A0A6L5X1W3_9FIRM|nr:L,D-transpeptidase family protein [Porcincola intestinalis]
MEDLGMKRSCKCFQRIWLGAFFLCLLLTVWTGEKNNAFAAATPSISQRIAYVPQGKKLRLRVRNVHSGRIVWASSNRNIARVSRKGVVRGISGGWARITAALPGGKVLSCRVKVQILKLAESRIDMAAGQRQRLTVETNIRRMKWKSSNPKVAAVSSSGRIHAKKAGTAQITAYYGKLKAICKVRVRRKKGTQSVEYQSGKPTQTTQTTQVSQSGQQDRWTRLLEMYQNESGVNQLLFVQYTGGSRADVLLYVKESGTWKCILTCDGEVGKNGIDKVKEGDKRTPTGTFRLTSGFGIQANPGTSMPYVRVNQYLYWCGDRYMYNRLVDIRKHPHKCAGEHLIDYTQCYAYGMFLDYNSANTPGKGSAIFLHCKGNSGYTAGCVAVSRQNMIEILRQVTDGARICIYHK